MLVNESQPQLNFQLAPTPEAEKLVVRKRDGRSEVFNDAHIQLALEAAYRDELNIGKDQPLPADVATTVAFLADAVVQKAIALANDGKDLEVELIQDLVENELMRSGQHAIARSYILYREERKKARLLRGGQQDADKHSRAVVPTLNVTLSDGTMEPLDPQHVRRTLIRACAGMEDRCDWRELAEETLRNLYDGVRCEEIDKAMIFAAKARVEREPAYSFVSARLLLNVIYREVLPATGNNSNQDIPNLVGRHREHFVEYLRQGIDLGRLDSSLLNFDLKKISAALRLDRDTRFNYMGLQTVYDRYLIHNAGHRLETPQYFWMRVAMGLSVLETEDQKNERAIEFYELLSSMRFVSSTPTLFNSGTLHPQLSSCYLSTVMDDLEHIFKVISDDAKLSKWAGGLGNDWSNVRATGAVIRGTNGESQGVVPFLKVANDTAVAVNQCFAPDTLVYTAEGPLPISGIRRGDLVLGISGTYREVTDTFAYNQLDPMVRVRVKHALEGITVTAGHPFYALRGMPLEQACARTMRWLAKGKLSTEWVEAGELRAGDYVAQIIPDEVVSVPGFTEDDARLYGILLGDGHLSKDGTQWGVSGHPQRDEHMQFVRSYLEERGVHFWETGRGETYAQVHWASGRGVIREATTGRIASAGAPTLPFATADMYDAQGRKRIARRYAHLPRAQTLALIQGLLETDGGVSRNKEIYFTNTSQPLAEGLRYQLLRLGVPVAGQYRERANEHQGRRSDGTVITFQGVTKVYDLRIPAVPEIAALVGCQPIVKRNWLTHAGCVFSRVRRVEPAPVTPFVFDLKVEGDESYQTAAGLAHNGGKRKGAMCAYLETWHLDIEDFMELRKNTGDERRRTHDMNTANWIPDLFMKRVARNEQWTLFNPSDCPDLHDLYGKKFEERYAQYEAMADRGEISLFRRVEAVTLWRKMLTMLFETGHPWLTFKDPSNVCSPQDHTGVVHSSNLCTEILLNTSEDEIAVCNLGSINLAEHISDDGLDAPLLESTIRTAMRMLDNVIDINYYPAPEARTANMRHRPVGMGLMGFQDALYKLEIPYASDAAVEFADRSMEMISYHAILASTELARERGTYQTYPGSKWDRGILPLDTKDLLERERGGHLDMDRSSNLDWEVVRAAIARHGMRNSNTMAIAPTATISNISGVGQSIEPTYKHLFAKSNLSGEFTTINVYLVEALKKLDLWDAEMIEDLKYYDGVLTEIERIPEHVKEVFRTAFEIDPRWLIECASRRQKWIDMGQSLNLYLAAPNGKKLNDMYMLAWQKGLKTTYYLRTLAATQIEKSTLDVNRRGAQPRWMKNKSASSAVKVERAASAPAPQSVPVTQPAPTVTAASIDDVTLSEEPATAVKMCSILDPGCESCQ